MATGFRDTVSFWETDDGHVKSIHEGGIVMAVKVLVATINTGETDTSNIVLDLSDADGANVGTLSVDRDVWDEFDSDTDTIVVDGVADIEVE